MGNLCFTEENAGVYNNLEVCYKCNDSFYYRKPRRTSCRFHDFDKNGQCIVCHKDKNTHGNCYHLKKVKYWGLFES
mgnify:FL=1